MPPMIISGINREGTIIQRFICRYEPEYINAAIRIVRLDINVVRIVIDIAV